MKRVVAWFIVASLVVAGCSSGAEPTETTSAPTTTSTTTTMVPTTTTAPPTTTTTIPQLELTKAGGPLSDLVRSLYGQAESARMKYPQPDAPEKLIAAFAKSSGPQPKKGAASVVEWGDDAYSAVVQVGDDITLAVADPEWRIVGGWWPSMKVKASLGSFPKIVAVVGSDARPRQDRETTRSDSIHFVGLDGKGSAGLIGVPRDSWVPIPGAGTSKINAALSLGGPEMMMDTFTELSGLEFDGYLLTGFAGFADLIEILGGLEIDVPRDFNDSAAKADIDAGKQILDAAQALAMSRTRKTLPRGDFQRQEHGGLVLMAAAAMVKAQGPTQLPLLITSARKHFSTDMDLGELLLLAASVTRVDPAKVVNVVAPGGTGSAGGASVVFLSDSADQMWEDLADGALEQD